MQKKKTKSKSKSSAKAQATTKVSPSASTRKASSSGGSGSGFLGLLLKSLVWGSLLLVLLVAAAVAYIVFSPDFSDVPPNPWDLNGKVSTEGLHFTKAKVNGITLNIIEAGPRDGRLLVMLHGFPETALISWYKHIKPLADKGYHVIAPDQRGYNQSEKPDSISDYIPDTLALDIAELIKQFGNGKKAYVVAHDWGGLVAWWLSIQHPSLVEKVTILNAPHPVAFRKKLFSSLEQAAKSWYIFFFQLPFIPEYKYQKDNFAFGRSLLAYSGILGSTYSQDAVDRLLQAWGEPNQMKSTINWYRSMRYRKGIPDPTVRVPLLLLWGKDDIALEESLVAPSLAFCENGRNVSFDGATHWLQHDRPTEVLNEISSFFSS